MNFLKRGTDFFNSKKEMITEQINSKASGLTEHINDYGTDAVNLSKETVSQPSNIVQKGIGDFTGEFDNITEQVKQKGDSIIAQGKDVALGSVPAPVMNGVQNLGFSTDNEGNPNPNGTKPSVVEGDKNAGKTSDRGSEWKLKADSNSINVAPGLSLSEINQNYNNSRHRDQRLGDTLPNTERAKKTEGIDVRHDYGVSVMVNQGQVQGPANNGDKNVNFARHNANPSNVYGRAAKGQLIYYVTEDGKLAAAKKIQRSKSHHVGMLGRAQTYRARMLDQNRMFYKSFSRPTRVETSYNSKGRQDHAFTTSTKIRRPSDKKSTFDDQDMGNITISSGNVKNHTASLNPTYLSHPMQQEGTIGNFYERANEYKAQTSDIVKQGSEIQNGIGKEKLLERAQDLKSSYIDPKFGQIGAIPSGIFGNISTNGTNPDVNEPTSQISASPLAGNISGITNAPRETIENVRNSLNPENLKQKAFGSFNLWSGSQSTSDSKADTTSPPNGKESGNAGLPMGVDSKLSEGKEKLAAFKNKFGIFGKSKDKDLDQTDAVNKPSAGGDKTDNPNPSNGKQIGKSVLPVSVNSKLSEGKEKLATFKDKFGVFGKSDQTDAVYKPSGGDDEKNSNGLNGVMDKFGGLSLPFGGKEENITDKMKAPGNYENGVFIARFEDTRGPSCNYTVGVIVRLTLVVINALTIVRTITVTKNHWNWGCAPICAIFMALEYSQVVFRRLGREWTWWVPCLLVYLVTTLPLIWQLQMNDMGTENGVPKKTDVWTIVASDAIVYLTIFARWLLQGGVVSLGTLASVIMDFIANASDIMDLLSLTDQPEVRASNMLMYWVLAAWSVSFIKFIPLIDIDGKSKDTKRLPKYIMINFGPLFTEALQIIFTLVLLDGSFLVIRIYLLVGEGVVTFSLVFFIVKNMISLGVQIRRLVVICKSMPWNQKQGDDEAELEYDSA